MPRQTAESCTVFSLDTDDFIGELEEVTIDVNNADEDGSAIAERWADPCPVSSEWTATGNAFVDNAPEFVKKAASSDPIVSVILTIGTSTYSGNALLSTASHETKRKALQKQGFTLKGKGALTITTTGGGG